MNGPLPARGLKIGWQGLNFLPGEVIEVEMDSVANLLPLAIMGVGVYLFFRWVVRDMNRPTGR